MGELYDEHGERLEFVGRKKTTVRGTIKTDGMGRVWISPDDVGSETLASILPDDVEMWPETGQKESDEYVFWIDVTVHTPTNEFREDDPHPSAADTE